MFDNISLALSGERPTAELLADFVEIGLVRGEYIFRDLQLYPTAPVAQEKMFAYLDLLFGLAPRRVVYRTMEVTVAEANVLAGVEEILHEDNQLMGLRGIRRHMRHPASLSAELAVLREIHRRHDGLTVIAPFVASADEFRWFRDRVRDEVGDCRLGTMLETPAAVLDAEALAAAGAEHFVVGTNDLGSLLAARARVPGGSTELGPGMVRALNLVRDVCDGHRCEMHVAGYLTPPLVEAATKAGAESCVVHYADLPRLLGDGYAHLPDLRHLADVKRRTRAAIDAHKTGPDGERQSSSCAV
ncbi:putative PEP-binding protein [Micromonospora sp. CPCC 205546]|uniref:putative PEP-binding protein n=1 Tax=Micromonospora sp. CPCC 205546 TaxID=3122397 RepID=UPI002FF19518